MRVLVTGQEGQLARSLAERAADHPELDIITTARGLVDLSNAGSVAAAIAAVRPDLVINAAAYTTVDLAEDEPALAFRINAEAAGEAADAALQAGAGIIQLSTDYVFDGESREPYREDAPANPMSVYGRSKLAGEEAVRAANPHHLILRTAWVYSPFGRNFVKTIVAAARDRDWLEVVDDQHGCPTSAIDLADAILAIADRWRQGEETGRGETYHLAGSGSASWFDLAGEIMEHCRRLGLPAAEVRPVATTERPGKAARPAYAVLDCVKIDRDLGIRLPEWRQSVAKTVERLAVS